MGEVVDFDGKKPLRTIEDPIEHTPGDATQLQLCLEDLTEEERIRLKRILANITIRLQEPECDCPEPSAEERAKERWFKGEGG
jgi:hypothetical protein